MARRVVVLTQFSETAKEPMVYRIARQCNLTPYLSRDRDAETGEMLTELEGEAKDLRRAAKQLSEEGIVVQSMSHVA